MKYLIVAGLVLFLTSCAAQSQEPLKMANAADMLENTDWQAIAINNGRGAMVSSQQSPHLVTARFDNGKIHGNGGCNQFSATYTRNGQQLRIGRLQATQRACAEAALMEQEAYFLKALAQASQYQFSSGQLELLDDNGALMVEFAKR